MRYAQSCRGRSGRQAGRADRKKQRTGSGEGVRGKKAPLGARGQRTQFRQATSHLRKEPQFPQGGFAERRHGPTSGSPHSARARTEDHAPPWPRGDVTAPLEPPTDWRELGWPERARSALPGQRWWCRWAPSCARLPGACSVGSRLATSDSPWPATEDSGTIPQMPR